MNYLHLCKPSILHRDLKPENLLLDLSDTLKVADFGLAKLRPLPKSGDDGGSSGSGGIGVGVKMMTGETGSYRYMAPEVAMHKDYSEKVDVYSFALVFYYMLHGAEPWPHLGGLEAAKAAVLELSRPPVPRHWDARLASLLKDSWAEDALARPSFTQVLSRLSELGREAATGAAAPSRPSLLRAATAPLRAGSCTAKRKGEGSYTEGCKVA
jgi:serine/threonine protein kinase